MKATLKRMFGVTFLWLSLAALVYVPTSGGGPQAAIVAGVGFVCFCVGIALFTEGVRSAAKQAR